MKNDISYILQFFDCLAVHSNLDQRCQFLFFCQSTTRNIVNKDWYHFRAFSIFCSVSTPFAFSIFLYFLTFFVSPSRCLRFYSFSSFSSPFSDFFLLLHFRSPFIALFASIHFLDFFLLLDSSSPSYASPCLFLLCFSILCLSILTFHEPFSLSRVVSLILPCHFYTNSRKSRYKKNLKHCMLIH